MFINNLKSKSRAFKFSLILNNSQLTTVDVQYFVSDTVSLYKIMGHLDFESATFLVVMGSESNLHEIMLYIIVFSIDLLLLNCSFKGLRCDKTFSVVMFSLVAWDLCQQLLCIYKS